METLLISLCIAAGSAVVDWALHGPLTRMAKKSKVKWDDKGLEATKAVWKAIRGRIRIKR